MPERYLSYDAKIPMFDRSLRGAFEMGETFFSGWTIAEAAH